MAENFTKDTIDYGEIQLSLAHEQNDLSHERTEMSVDRTNMAKKRTSMAQTRTDMAFARTELANSQTLLSYIRTAIAVFAAGIGMFEFLRDPTIVQLGKVVMAVSPVILIVGIVHFFIMRKKIFDWKDNQKK